MANQNEMMDRSFSPTAAGVEIEAVTVADLRARADRLMQRPGRVPFHVAIVCTEGEGLHEVDFAPILLKPGRVVHVRPGQVHRWRFARIGQV